MKAFILLLASSVAGICASEGIPDATRESPQNDKSAIIPQKNYGGRVNPEDILPMPQCIAQQDQSAWLSAMTSCTSKQCTSHFGVICTHHQWLTDLSCLSDALSPAVIEEYLPYCGRSILAKAQLYQWVHNVTARTWLVKVGDANELYSLSPASLIEGYTPIATAQKAPSCLKTSLTEKSMEPLEEVVASCGFTSVTEHNGNAARPWEYNEAHHSIKALSHQTAGYDLTHATISPGTYFDNDCFCATFISNVTELSCINADSFELTKERLWINATCGSDSLPKDWTSSLIIPGFDYIPTDLWRWPRCVKDMPTQVTELVNQCSTRACGQQNGYCDAKRTIDRACFCRDIRYESCNGSCKVFENRIEYVNWLNDLCGHLSGWDGLPENWRQLAAPLPDEIIPWEWSIGKSPDSNRAMGYWVLSSFAFVNIATVLFMLFFRNLEVLRHKRLLFWSQLLRDRNLTSISIIAIHVLANLLNSCLITAVPGCEHIPILELTLLWCTAPRLSWIAIFFIRTPFNVAATEFIFSPSLLAEAVLQLASSYYMVLTFLYGWKHDFYSGGLTGSDRVTDAELLYFGALTWLVVIVVASAYLLPILNKTMMKRPWRSVFFKWDYVEVVGFARNYRSYGTLALQSENIHITRNEIAKIGQLAMISCIALWVAQWMFWFGLIGVGGEDFLRPDACLLTIIWTASCIVNVVLGVLA